MATTPHTDAIRLLEAMAQSHPEEADLTFESWELGFNSARMDQAVNALLAIGCIEVETAGAPMYARRAWLTAKGVELARSQGHGVAERPGDRRRGARDRRMALVSSPPAGVVERRRTTRDRRHLLAA